MSEEQPDPDDGEETSEASPPEASGPTGGATAFSNRTDPESEANGWPRKTLLVSAGVLAVVVLASLALFWPASSASFEADPTATEISVDLAEEGIPDAVVDLTDERALVRYNVPQDLSAEGSWLVVFDSLLQQAAESERAVLQVYEDGDPSQEVEVDMEDVGAYFEARISWEEFQDRMDVRTVG